MIERQRMETIKSGRKRRCPYCGSNKWKRLEKGLLTTKEIFDSPIKFLSVKYRCESCGKEFIAEECTKTKYVDNTEQCYFCRSRNIEKVSCKDADVGLYRCKQCNAYMGMKNKKLKL